ncbi:MULTISPECIES: hypothetical protein [unclassified Streptomyces]|uniref:Uncharacterized protein n=1 Tax=Streptomyces sp. NBC_00060 TaxID=2975636 RepID=A0AAU2H2C3_9ACTN
MTFSSEDSEPPKTLSDIASPLSEAVEITPNRPISHAKVVIRIDPADLSSNKSLKATPDNAFIAIFDPIYKIWAPLPTTHSADSRELSAEAPHFSIFRAFFVKPSFAPWWTEHISGLAALVHDTLVKAGTGILAAGYSMLNGEQEEIDCSSASNKWKIESKVSEVRGCVSSNDAAPQVHLRSSLRYALISSSATHPSASYDPDDGLLDNLSRILNARIGLVYIPARGTADSALFPVADSDAKHESLSLKSDYLAFALRAIFGTLAFVPSSGKFLELIVKDASIRTTVVRLIGENADVVTVEREIRAVLSLQPKEISQKPGMLSIAPIVVDALECASKGIETVKERTIKGALTSIALLTHTCLSSVLEAAKKALKIETSSIYDIVAAFPGGVQLFGTIWDFVRQGVFYGVEFTVTAQHPGTPLPKQWARIESRSTTSTNVTFQPFEHLEGQAAQDECRREGIPEGYWTETYCSNSFDKYPNPIITQTLPITSTAELTYKGRRDDPYCPGGSDPCRRPISDLPRLSANAPMATLTIADGKVTKIELHWRP